MRGAVTDGQRRRGRDGQQGGGLRKCTSGMRGGLLSPVINRGYRSANRGLVCKPAMHATLAIAENAYPGTPCGGSLSNERSSPEASLAAMQAPCWMRSALRCRR